ncbi:unnamed protein product [Parajaminaea phylloscopi]
MNVRHTTPTAPRTSMLSVGRNSLGPGASTPSSRLQATPTPASRLGPRNSSAHTASVSASHTGRPPPVPPLDSRYAHQTASSSAKLRHTSPLSLEDLGAEVKVVDGNEQGYRGVLRYLGEIEGKGKAIFAGIELLDEWKSLGKNDGVVAGVQYFATEPKCGMFLAPSRLQRVSQEAPTDAVARPQSAMSGRASRASEHDVFDRPPSTTPARRRGSVAPSSIARPASSAASHRSLSRASMGPDGGVAATRPASRSSIAPRRTLHEEDTPARSRALASAEQVAAAQRRINPGSRAAQMMNMKASDLAARKHGGVSESFDEGTSRGSAVLKPTGTSSDTLNDAADVDDGESHSSPSARMSPLKDTLTNRAALLHPALSRPSFDPTTPGMLPKGRKSTVDPRTAAGHTPFRPSVASRGVSSASTISAVGTRSPFDSSEAMPPPVSASNTSASRHQRTASSAAAATPPRPGTSHSRPASVASLRSSPSRSASVLSHRHADMLGSEEDDRGSELLPSMRAQKARSLALLDQMDLDATPKKQEGAALNRPSSRLSSASHRTGGDVAEAVVSLGVYEELYNELTLKTAALAELQRSHGDLVRQRDTRDGEIAREKKRLRDDQEQLKRLLEEERETEREDEKRRRREIELKEKTARTELEAAKRDLKRVLEESSKRQSDSEKSNEELKARLAENEALCDELKKALAVRETEATSVDGSVKTELESQVQAKDAELEQISTRLKRLESQWHSERAELDREIEELKEAGQETITLYELRLEEAAEDHRTLVDDLEVRVGDLQNKLHDSVTAAEEQKTLAAKSGTGRGFGESAAEIDRASLQEQLSHTQDKLLATEDQLAEANASLDADREAARRRKEKAQEVEVRWKAEVKRLKSEIERLLNEVAQAREKTDELAEALEERGTALESERAELETLRAEAAGQSSLIGEAEQPASAMVSKMKAEIDQLTALLEGARSGKREASRKAEELERQLAMLRSSATLSGLDQSPITSLRSPTLLPVSDTSADARRVSTASNSSRRSGNSTNLRDSLDPATAQSRELAGLRSIVNALSEENANLTAKLKGAGAESSWNPATKEKANGERGQGPTGQADNVEDLRSRLTSVDAERASLDRKNQELAREVSDLESLVEAGMWAKEELEAKLEDSWKKIAQLKAAESDKRAATTENVSAAQSRSRESAAGQPIDTSAHKGNATAAPRGATTAPEPETKPITESAEAGSGGREACDDCGSTEHTLENCPLLDEIF